MIEMDTRRHGKDIILNKFLHKILDSIPEFNEDITKLILEYKIFDPIYKTIFNCHWCDVVTVKNIPFESYNFIHWELPCHPSNLGSSQVDVIYNIETDVGVTTESFKGECYESD